MNITVLGAFIVLLFQLIDELLTDKKVWRVVFYSSGLFLTAPAVCFNLYDFFFSGRSKTKRIKRQLEIFIFGVPASDKNEKSRRLHGKDMYCNQACLKPTVCSCYESVGLSLSHGVNQMYSHKSQLNLGMLEPPDFRFGVTYNINDLKVVIGPPSTGYFISLSYNSGEHWRFTPGINGDQAAMLHQLLKIWEDSPCCGIVDVTRRCHCFSVQELVELVKKEEGVFSLYNRREVRVYFENSDTRIISGDFVSSLVCEGNSKSIIESMENNLLIDSRLRKTFDCNSDTVLKYLRIRCKEKYNDVYSLLNHLGNLSVFRKYLCPIMGNWQTKRIIGDLSAIRKLSTGYHLKQADRVPATRFLLKFLKENKLIEYELDDSQIPRYIEAPTHRIVDLHKARQSSKKIDPKIEVLEWHRPKYNVKLFGQEFFPQLVETKESIQNSKPADNPKTVKKPKKQKSQALVKIDDRLIEKTRVRINHLRKLIKAERRKGKYEINYFNLEKHISEIANLKRGTIGNKKIIDNGINLPQSIKDEVVCSYKGALLTKSRNYNAKRVEDFYNLFKIRNEIQTNRQKMEIKNLETKIMNERKRQNVEFEENLKKVKKVKHISKYKLKPKYSPLNPKLDYVNPFDLLNDVDSTGIDTDRLTSAYTFMNDNGFGKRRRKAIVKNVLGLKCDKILINQVEKDWKVTKHKMNPVLNKLKTDLNTIYDNTLKDNPCIRLVLIDEFNNDQLPTNRSQKPNRRVKIDKERRDNWRNDKLKLSKRAFIRKYLNVSYKILPKKRAYEHCSNVVAILSNKKQSMDIKSIGRFYINS